MSSAKSKKPVVETKSIEKLNDDDVLEGTVVVKGAAPYEDVRVQLETQLVNILRNWDTKQAESVAGRLGLASVLKYTRHWVGTQPAQFDPARGLKALDPGKVVNATQWKEQLKRDILASATPVVLRELKRVAQEMDASGITKVMAHRGLGNAQGGSAVARVYGTTKDAEKSVSDVLKPLERIVDMAATRQAKRVEQKIRDMDASGATIGQIKAEVQRMIGQRSTWSQGLAEFVSGSAIEGVRAKTYALAGPIVKKVWVTVGDEDVRPTHKRVDQKERPNSGRFTVGAYKMAHPGDPTAGPEETANCRCFLEFEISERYADVYDELAA